MYRSLQEYVDFLESKDELIRIKEFVDPILEIAHVTNLVSKKEGGGKALLFENTGTKYPVLTNMMGSEKRIKYALGINSFDDISERINSFISDVMKEKKGMMDKIKLLPILNNASNWLPVNIKGHAPCQDSIQYAAKLSDLPILKCWPQDGGRFITLPLVHTNSPVTGTRNVGMYRMQVFSENSTGMHWHIHKTGAKHLEECTHRLPVAVCLGGDPVYTYAATAPLPEGIDEYILAGFLRNKQVELVQCFTQDIKVPADCDFVFEGYVQKSEPKVVEGPFGDHTGFYSLADKYPTFHITCITHRNNAIYPATIVGIPPQEDKYIALATEKIFLTPIQLAIAPEIEDLYLPEEGIGHNFAVIKIKKSYPGQAIKIANALWGAGQMMFSKFIIIVSENIDIRNRHSLAEEISKNYSPQRDTILSRGPLDILDHTAPICGYGGKICIDATVKTTDEKTLGDEVSLKSSFIEFTHKKHIENNENGNPLISVILDEDADTSNSYNSLWLLGCNCDPERDSEIKNGTLILDARSKKGRKNFTREWPDMVEADKTTIDAVNKRWNKLGID
ncbi:MAG: menaquinone biosynthesis decarboxylase [Bacteroidales bacterium]|jgi:4-hydroxy-3-polyprenylbenzoate decarboxylase